MHARGPFASAQRSVRLAVTLALAVALGTPGPGQAQIVRDGTVGPVGPLTGPNYTIAHTDGTRAGPNLFHSFSRFNLHTGESATFTGPNDISNVISRVTGGERSTIDGLLRSQVGQANFWFLNPAGVLFGPHAQIDVPAAFHVSTADEVRFADGARFSASDPAANTLTVAPPEAFGFLRPTPAAIEVTSSTLKTRAGGTLSVAGGDLQVTGGRLVSAGGQVTLTALAGPGTVQAATGASSGPARGTVRLTKGARVDTSGDGGGRIVLRGGQIEVTGSQVRADNTGTRNAAGGIDIVGDTVGVASGEISSIARAAGKAGRVSVQTRALAMQNRAAIDSVTFSRGDAGTVRVQAETMQLDGGSIITTATQASGHAGTVAVATGNLAMRGSSLIDSSTLGSGDAGTASVTASGSIALNDRAGITSFTAGQGNAGRVRVQAETMQLDGGSIITTATQASGHAGTVAVTTGNLAMRGSSLIDSSTLGSEDAGTVSVTASGSIALNDRAGITSFTAGQGNAGEVTVHAGRLSVTGNAGQTSPGIRNDATIGSSGSAGAVTVTAPDIVLSDGGRISSSTHSTRGNAGPMTIDTERLTIAGTDSGIFSDAGLSTRGNAGPITVAAHDLQIANSGQISSSTFDRGNAGPVTINTGQLTVTGNAGQTFTGIQSDAMVGSSGGAGAVAVTAHDIVLNNSAMIASATAGRGNAGTVTMQADRIAITGRYTGISSDALQGPGNAGSVTVAARDLQIANRGQISSSTYDRGNAGRVSVQTHVLAMQNRAAIGSVTSSRGDAGTVTVQAETMQLDGGSGITTLTESSGHAGTVVMRTDNLAMRDSLIDSSTLGSGNAGTVSVTASGSIVLNDGAKITSFTTGRGNAGTVTVQVDRIAITGSSTAGYTGISSDAKERSTGKAGDVRVTAHEIALTDSGYISSDTWGAAPAGTVQVTAPEGTLDLRNGGWISSDSYAESDKGRAGDVSVTAREIRLADRSYISSVTRSAAPAGNVSVGGGEIALASGAMISTGTWAAGNAGMVAIDAGKLSASGETTTIASSAVAGSTGVGGSVTIKGDTITLAGGAAVTTQSDGQGHAGNVDVSARGNLQLNDGAQIASSATLADAGPVTVTAAGSLQMTGSAITTGAEQGGGGQIRLTVGRLIDLADSQVTSSVVSQASTTNAGNITIDPRFLVLDRSLIKANAVGGNGGNLTITAGYLIPSPDSRIEASSQLGINGQVNIQAPNPDLGARLTELPIAFLNAAALLPTACAERFGTDLSSLTSRGLAPLPADPDRPWLMPYLGRGSATPALVAGAAARQPSAASGSITPSLSFYCRR